MKFTEDKKKKGKNILNYSTFRYKHPSRPWVFYNEDGTTSIVGPVIKNKTG